MLTVVIKDDGEANVIKLTYENLWRELKDIAGAELLVSKDWFAPLEKTKNVYICFVEADCLVSSGYFASQLGLFKKNAYFRKLSMLTSAVGVNNWANRVYGYDLGNDNSDGVVPNLLKKSSAVYPVQVGFLPGAIVRAKMLQRAFKSAPEIRDDKNLVKLSADLSLTFWRQGDGNPVHINPNTTYVTTEGYVNDIGKFQLKPGNLVAKFLKESI